MTRIVLASVFAFAIVGLARADELTDVRDQQKLLAQKWSQQVTVALDAARRLERTDPAGARDVLQSALAGLRSAAALDEKTRQELARPIEARLGVRTAVRPPLVPPSTPAPAPTTVAQAPSPYAPAPSGSLNDTAKSFYQRTKDKVDAGKIQKVEAGKTFNSTIGGIEKPAATPTGDQAIVLAPDHKEIMAKREVKLNTKEAAVMNVLGTQISVDFTGFTLRQSLEYLNTKTGLLIIPDAQSLKEANVDLDEQTNFKSNSKLTVRSILRRILADKGLSYIVNENGVDVVTIERARQATVVRAYPIMDLVTPIGPQPQVVIDPFTGRLIPNIPGLGLATPKNIAGAQIADLIKTTIDPSYWQPNGPGTIAFHEATGTLVVRASAEIQFMISNAIYKR